MKRRLAAVLLLAFSMSILSVGCGNGQTKPSQDTGDANKADQAQQGDGSWERVKTAGKIVVGLDDAYAPMGFRDENNNLTGFDVEMGKLIGDKIGVPFEFVPADWNSVVPSLISGKFDTIISGMNMLPDRVAEMNFVPYGIASQYILVKTDYAETDEVKDISFFKDKKVATQLGSTAAIALTEQGFEEETNLVLHKEFPSALLDLDNGRVQAVVLDSFTAAAATTTVDQDGNYKYKVVGAPVVDANVAQKDDSAKIGIAFSKKDLELQARIQQAVSELIADGTLGELSKKWINGTDITEGLKADAVKAVTGEK